MKKDGSMHHYKIKGAECPGLGCVPVVEKVVKEY